MAIDKAGVSVCMPYYERRESLRRTMEAFKEIYTGAPFDIEISVVDDGSIVEPLSWQWMTQWLLPFRFHSLPEHAEWLNPCVPLNAAVRQATHEIILLQHPEVTHRVDCITPMLDALETKDMTVLCPVKEERPDKGNRRWVLHPSLPRRYWFCQMMPKDLYWRVGGMDERFRPGVGFEDDALEIELNRIGAKWAWIPERYHCLHPWLYDKQQPKDNLALFNKLYPECAR